jgi:hypothetical protein
VATKIRERQPVVAAIGKVRVNQVLGISKPDGDNKASGGHRIRRDSPATGVPHLNKILGVLPLNSNRLLTLGVLLLSNNRLILGVLPLSNNRLIPGVLPLNSNQLLILGVLLLSNNRLILGVLPLNSNQLLILGVLLLSNNRLILGVLPLNSNNRLILGILLLLLLRRRQLRTPGGNSRQLRPNSQTGVHLRQSSRVNKRQPHSASVAHPQLQAGGNLNQQIHGQIKRHHQPHNPMASKLQVLPAHPGSKAMLAHRGELVSQAMSPTKRCYAQARLLNRAA